MFVIQKNLLASKMTEVFAMKYGKRSFEIDGFIPASERTVQKHTLLLCQSLWRLMEKLQLE